MMKKRSATGSHTVARGRSTVSISKTGFIGFVLAGMALLVMVVAGLVQKYEQTHQSAFENAGNVFPLIEAGLTRRVATFTSQATAAAAEFSRYPESDSFTARIDRHFPGHQGAEFFPVGYKSMQSPQGKTLSYGSLVMLREAEASERSTLVWVQGSDQTNRHVAFGHRVVDPGGAVLGVIAVNLGMDSIESILRQIPVDIGRFELHQVSGGTKSLMVAAIGDASIAEGAPHKVGSIPNTQWELRFWRASVPMFVLDKGSMVLLAVAATVLAGMALGFVLLFRNLREKLRQDQIDLITAYEGRLHGTAAVKLVAHLADNAGLLAHINRLNEERLAEVEASSDKDTETGEPEELLQALYAKEFEPDPDNMAVDNLMRDLESQQESKVPVSADSDGATAESVPLPEPLKNISDDALEFAFELEPWPEPEEDEPDFPIENKDSR